MKIFSITILSEAKRPQIECLSPKGEFSICSEVGYWGSGYWMGSGILFRLVPLPQKQECLSTEEMLYTGERISW